MLDHDPSTVNRVPHFDNLITSGSYHVLIRGVHVGNLRTLFLDTNGAFAPDSVRPESIQVEGTMKISKDND